jgi:hypothetical protein
VQYQPSFAVSAVSSLIDEVNTQLTPVNGLNAVSAYRSVGADAGVDLVHDWTWRYRTGVAYAFGQQHFLNGPDFDRRNHGVSAQQQWNFMRDAGIKALYRYSDMIMKRQNGADYPVTSRSAELAISYQHRLSATRRFAFSAGGGAARLRQPSLVTNEPFETTAPSGFVSGQVDVGRTWAVSADYRRAVGVLTMLTDSAFFTDALSLSGGGSVGRHAELLFSAAGSRGSAPGNRAGSFRNLESTVQLGYAISACCSALVDYSYFDNQFAQLPQSISGFALQHGSAIRVGMTVGVALAGPRPPRRPR